MWTEICKFESKYGSDAPPFNVGIWKLPSRGQEVLLGGSFLFDWSWAPCSFPLHNLLPYLWAWLLWLQTRFSHRRHIDFQQPDSQRGMQKECKSLFKFKNPLYFSVAYLGKMSLFNRHFQVFILYFPTAPMLIMLNIALVKKSQPKAVSITTVDS